MARRSYLSRLARPLTPADPVVWSTPRAAPEEARQAIPSIVHPTPTPQAATKSGTPPEIDKTAPATVPGFSQQPPRSTGMPGETMTEARRARAMQRPIPPQSSANGRASPMPVAATARDVTGEPARAPRDQRAIMVEPAYMPAEARNDADAPGRRATATAADRDRSAPERPAAAPPPTPRKHFESAAISGPQSVPTSAVRKPEVPRLHIGAIEIRTSQPPATPPASPPVIIAAPAAPAAATSIARGYASRFGLAQG